MDGSSIAGAEAFDFLVTFFAEVLEEDALEAFFAFLPAGLAFLAPFLAPFLAAFLFAPLLAFFAVFFATI